MAKINKQIEKYETFSFDPRIISKKNRPAMILNGKISGLENGIRKSLLSAIMIINRFWSLF